MGLVVRDCELAEVKKLEPQLADDITSAFFLSSEAYVDNLKLPQILKKELQVLGCRVLENSPIESISIANGEIQGITLRSQEKLTADVYVLATGLKHGIVSLESALPLPLRPVKGQSLAVQCAPGTIHHPIRFFAKHSLYLVPRASGEIVVAATTEDGDDELVTPQGLNELIEDAREILPLIMTKPISRLWAGLRPATPDLKPIAGPSPIKNLFLLLGLYRHGVKISPYFASELAKVINGEKSEIDFSAYRLDRFS
jgi:glycine oxidase